MRPIGKLVPLSFTLALAACASTNPPAELVSARSAYARAANGDAKQVPAELHEAKVALDRAETSFQSDGASPATRDYSYIAERKALRAESLGRTAEANKEKTTADAERQEVMSKLVQKSETDAKKAAEEARKAGEQAASAKSAYESAQSAYEKERVAREAAEKRAQTAMEALAKTEAVKKEERGYVITLSGSVLFAFGKSEILPSARRRLDEVADALKASPDQTFVVEGHTDNVGSDATNQALSEKRAQAVRDYLIDRGVDSKSISAVGKGKEAPVDTNATAEGRAINRRVEIVVKPMKGGETGTGGGPKTENK